MLGVSPHNHFALFAEVKVGANRAFVANPDNWTLVTAIAKDILVDYLSLRLSLLIQHLFKELFEVVGAVFLELGFDHLVEIFRFLLLLLNWGGLKTQNICLNRLFFDFFTGGRSKELSSQFGFFASLVNVSHVNCQRFLSS